MDLDVYWRKINFNNDAGADVNVISKSTWVALGRPAIRAAAAVTLLSPRDKTDVRGLFETQLNDMPATVYVFDNNDGHSLFSKRTASKIGLVKRARSCVWRSEVSAS